MFKLSWRPKRSNSSKRKFSPVREVLEEVLGFEPELPDDPDVDYYESLVKSWERMERLEAWHHLVAMLNDMDKKMTESWRKGEKGADKLQQAANLCANIPKLGEVARQRLDEAKARQSNKARSEGWASRGRAN